MYNVGNLSLGELFGLRLLQLGDLGGGFGTQGGSSPVLSDLLTAFIEVRLDGLDQFVQRRAITRFNLEQSQ